MLREHLLTTLDHALAVLQDRRQLRILDVRVQDPRAALAWWHDDRLTVDLGTQRRCVRVLRV